MVTKSRLYAALRFMHGQRQRLRRWDGRFFATSAGNMMYPACVRQAFHPIRGQFRNRRSVHPILRWQRISPDSCDKMTKIAVTEGMVHQFAPLLRSATERADDMQDRYIFRVTARDTVNSAKFSHAKGGE